MQAGPRRRQVGPGPVRQAPRPARQGRPWLRPPRADGPADQQRRRDALLVRGGRVDRGPAARRRAAEGTEEMKWNLRLAAANRSIWKASELQRMLAERDLVISAGKMSGLWSGDPASIKLSDLDVICTVLDCGVEELRIPEPDKVTSGKEQEGQAAVSASPAGP